LIKPSWSTQDSGQVFLESVCRTCLAHELRTAGQKIVCERLVPIVYDGIELDGYRLDMLVNDAVIVEVKTVERLLPVHKAQLLSYLKLLDKRLGLLINFKTPQVMQGVKRIVNDF
jgi:GxxExxY protein